VRGNPRATGEKCGPAGRADDDEKRAAGRAAQKLSDDLAAAKVEREKVEKSRPTTTRDEREKVEKNPRDGYARSSEPTSTLFVSNIPRATTAAQLRAMFNKCAPPTAHPPHATTPLPRPRSRSTRRTRVAGSAR